MLEKASNRELILAAAGVEHGNWKRLCSLAAKNAGPPVTYRSAKRVYYGEITNPAHKVIQRLREVARRHVTREQQATELERVAHELDVKDPDFHREHINALRTIASLARGLGLPKAG